MEGQVTIGVEFNTYIVRVNGKVIKLQIWDTAGQENFRSVTKIFYRNAHACILTYAIDSQSSFQNVKHWLNEVRAQCSNDTLIFLTGTKQDLDAQGGRKVPEQTALAFQ